MSDLDREVLFSNEAFVIGMLQAVSGGSIFAALSQAKVLIEYAGHLSFLLFLTFMPLSLASALIAAYFRHQYKMWDVKAQAAAIRIDKGTAEEDSSRARRYLKGMRYMMGTAVFSILLGLVELVAALWYQI